MTICRVCPGAADQHRRGHLGGVGADPGTSIPIDQFFIARAGVDTAATINAALAQGKHLMSTPGISPLDDTIRVNNADTVVSGLGFATLSAPPHIRTHVRDPCLDPCLWKVS